MPPYAFREYHTEMTSAKFVSDGGPRHGYRAEEGYVPYPHEVTFYVTFLVKCITLVLGLVGNGLTVFIFARHRRLRSATNTYIINIAMTDVLVTLSCPLVMIVTDLSGTWPLDTVTCQLSQATMEFSTCSTVLTLTVLSVERYYAVVHPIERHLSTQRFTLIVNLIIWIVALLFSTPKFVYSGIRTQRLNGTQGYTTVTFCAYKGDSRVAQYMSLLEFFLFYVIPFIVVCSMYKILSLHLRENSKIMSSRLSIQGKQHHHLTNNRVVLMVQVLSAIFFVGFLPYNILRVRIFVFGGDKSYWNTAASYAYCFGCLHFWLNPVAMYFLCETFRKYYNQYLFSWFFRWKDKLLAREVKHGREPPDTTLTNAPNTEITLEKYDTEQDYEIIVLRPVKENISEGHSADSEIVKL